MFEMSSPKSDLSKADSKMDGQYDSTSTPEAFKMLKSLSAVTLCPSSWRINDAYAQANSDESAFFF